MTPAALIAARDGDASATAAATALWEGIVGDGTAPARVPGPYAGTALDLIGQHVGSTTDVPDRVLAEAVTRSGMYMLNTEPGIGRREVEIGSIKLSPSSPAANLLRASGSMSLLLPWTAKRAGLI